MIEEYKKQQSRQDGGATGASAAGSSPAGKEIEPALAHTGHQRLLAGRPFSVAADVACSSVRLCRNSGR